MRRLINASIAVLVLGIAGSLVLCAIPKIRDAANRAQCQNNLKQIGFSLYNRCDTYGTFSPATIPNEELSCGKRLSWLVDAIPFIEQNQVYNNLDPKKGWQDEPNLIPKIPPRDPHDDHIIGPPLPVGEIKLFRCPSDPTASPTDTASLTNYVGISGVGPHAAELPLEYPGVGFFGCERKLKLEDIKDGTANTIAIMETNRDLGPWTAGGFATVRPLDPAMAPYLDTGRPFGSSHRGVTQAVFADGSVHSLTKSVQPQVLEALATIAGGEKTEPLHD